MNQFINYLRNTRGELSHVSFPTQKQAIIYTALVVVISLVTAFLLGFLDFALTRLLDLIVLN